MPIKQTDPEEEYFKQAEIAKLRRQREQTARQMEQRQREELKKLHWMRCPKCGMELAEVDYRKVRVDTCFSCGGMYLDAGEIDKIVQFEEPGWVDKMARHLFGPEKD